MLLSPKTSRYSVQLAYFNCSYPYLLAFPSTCALSGHHGGCYIRVGYGVKDTSARPAVLHGAGGPVALNVLEQAHRVAITGHVVVRVASERVEITLTVSYADHRGRSHTMSGGCFDDDALYCYRRWLYMHFRNVGCWFGFLSSRRLIGRNRDGGGGYLFGASMAIAGAFTALRASWTAAWVLASCEAL